MYLGASRTRRHRTNDEEESGHPEYDGGCGEVPVIQNSKVDGFVYLVFWLDKWLFNSDRFQLAMRPAIFCRRNQQSDGRTGDDINITWQIKSPEILDRYVGPVRFN